MKRAKLILKLQGLVAVLLLALTLVACGGENTATSQATATTAAASTTAASTSAATTTAASATTAAANTSAATTTAATTTTTADASLKTEIKIADGLRQTETALLKEQIDTFKKAYPNVKVTSTHYNPEELSELLKSTAGTNLAPDLIIAPSDYVADWTADAKVIQPADKVFDANLLKGYAPNALGASQLGGVQWGVPYNYGNVAVLLYNTKLVPTPPATTDDMIALAKQLNEKPLDGNKKERHIGLAIDINTPTWFVAFLGGFGGSVLNSSNQPTLDTPEMVKALQFYHDLAYKDKVTTPQFEFGDNQAEYAFRDGRLGMMVSGDWNIASYGGAKPKKAAALAATPTPAASPNSNGGAGNLEVTPGANDYADKFELGVAPLPKVSATGKYAAPLINNKALFIGSQTKGDQLNAAKAFVQFLAKPEQQSAMIAKGLVPTTLTALNSEELKGNPF